MMDAVKDSRETVARPAFDDLMLAMDAVDTIRHETSVLENELSGDERREALKVRLREYYAGQGIEVSDEVLATAVADMDKNRFVHEPLKPGLARTLAAIYVRRVRYAWRTVAAAALLASAFGAYSFAHHQLVVKPRELAAIERVAQLETKLPLALAEAHAKAVAAAREYGDDAAVAVADNHRSAAGTLIAAGDVDGAAAEIARLQELGSGIRSKIKVAALLDGASEARAAALAVDADSGARAALDAASERLQSAAASGQEAAYAKARADLQELVRKVDSKLDLRIVDREGTRTGVWRTNDGGHTKVFYLVVEAIDPAGRAVPMKIRSVETGRTETVTHWGVRVPEREYNRVGQDKASDGIVDDREAGTKPAGSLDFSWRLPVQNGHMITSW